MDHAGYSLCCLVARGTEVCEISLRRAFWAGFLHLEHAAVIRRLGERFSLELRRKCLLFKRVTWGERERKRSCLILQFKYI